MVASLSPSHLAGQIFDPYRHFTFNILISAFLLKTYHSLILFPTAYVLFSEKNSLALIFIVLERIYFIDLL